MTGSVRFDFFKVELDRKIGSVSVNRMALIFIGCFRVLKHTLLRKNLKNFFDWDSNLKIFLLLGLEAQKVEKHCSKGWLL